MNRWFLCSAGTWLIVWFHAQADPVRSNGKGGGSWSAPTTWQGGKVPAGESVAILGKDVVDLDATAGTAVVCEELVIDPQGVLRVIGQNKTTLTLTLRKALRIFGGMIVDFSKDPQGRCDVQLMHSNASPPEFLASDGCKILWKGAAWNTGMSNASPNVVVRVMLPTNAIPATAATPPPKPVPFTLGPKMWVECDGVKLEGWEIMANGMDGSELKFNERCAFRNCQFLRSPVTFQTCTKIEFERNLLQESPTFGVYLYSTSHSRFTSNVVDRTGPSAAAITSYGASDCEIAGNTLRHSSYGMNLVACADLFLIENRFEENGYGLMLNSCARITSQQCVFFSNTVMDVIATYATPGEPMRFYDCVFQNPPTNVNAYCLSAEGVVALEIVNSPLKTYAKEGTRGPITFSAYVDVFVSNEQGEPLGRVPLRVLAGSKVVATSRTEAIGRWAGHTPLPSSHRPLVVPWLRFAPAEGIPNPPASMSYQLEVDGTTLGYAKQAVPLVVDASFVRADPEKPVKTLTVKLAKK